MAFNRWFFAILLLVVGCTTDEVELNYTLASAIANKEVVMGNVIACAASNEDANAVSIFFYPRESASNINFYHTQDVEVDKDDFSAYTKGDAPILDVFNGYLLRFDVAPATEQWVVVSFEEDGKTHLSNPIRLKQQTKPTEYLPANTTYEAMENMPLFSWQDGAFDDTVIYFQVVSDAMGNLLSGTYTTTPQFQYYKLDNVVLNVTRETPPALVRDTNYGFTLMGVSEDNWVNLISVINFQLP